jgi:hypothetical protein
MKHILCFYSTFLLSVVAYSQSKQKKFTGYENYRKVEIHLKKQEPQAIVNLPFKTINILDYRNDTSVLGFAKDKEPFYNTSQVSFVFKTSVAQAIMFYLNKMISTNDSSDLNFLITVRKLYASNEIENDSIYDGNLRMQHSYMPGLISSFELYLNKGSEFIPIKRFDTTILMSKELESGISEMMSQTLNALLRHVAAITPEQWNKKNKYLSFHKIDSFSSQRQFYPVLLENVYKKGVYKSFEEFKNNTPSISDYSIKKTEKADLLYVKDEQGQELPIRKVWGFCDGTTIYINSGNIYFPLFKYKRNFYAFATKHLTKTKTINAAAEAGKFILGLGTVGPSWKYDMKLKTSLMQLDLQSGVLY